MTIVLKDPHSNKQGKKILLQQVQAESLIQQPHLTYSASKDIRVEVDTEYLPVLAKKIKKYFDDLNEKRNGMHVFEISDCLRKALLVKKHAKDIQLDIYDYMNFIQGLLSETKMV